MCGIARKLGIMIAVLLCFFENSTCHIVVCHRFVIYKIQILVFLVSISKMRKLKNESLRIVILGCVVRTV